MVVGGRGLGDCPGDHALNHLSEALQSVVIDVFQRQVLEGVFGLLVDGPSLHR